MAAAEAAAPLVTRNKAEYARVVNDLKCIALLMEFYNAKTKAAEQVMLYGYEPDAAHLHNADTLLAASVERFRALTALAGPAYVTATAMETTQRQIPFRGGMNQFPNWQQCLPMYEKELATFRKRVALVESGKGAQQEQASGPLPQVAFTLLPGAGETFTVEQGAAVFADRGVTIRTLAPELNGLRGIRIASRAGGTLRVKLDKPAQMLVGFVRDASRKESVLDPETQQWNLVMLNAVTAGKLPPLAVWAKPLPAGESELDMGKGAYVVLGFVPEDLHMAPHVNEAQNAGGAENLDWMFE